MAASVPIHDQLAALADDTRSRALLVLDRHELTVGELMQVLQLPQSTMSRHLKVLADAGWVSSRAEGTSRVYSMSEPEPGARKLWQAVRDRVAHTAAARHDLARIRGVLSARRAKSQEFFAGAAGQWASLREELFGVRPTFGAILGLLDDAWTVGDLGCGTGQVTELIAPFVSRVVAVDASKAMLAAARRNLSVADNVDFRHGELETLPVESQELDAAVMLLVLHYVSEPIAALSEASRALKPSGRLLVVDMVPHDRDDLQHRMGHIWRGFSEEQVRAWMQEAGLENVRYHEMEPDPQAKGPGLFAAVARRS